MSEAEKWAKFVFSDVDPADINNRDPMHQIAIISHEENPKGFAVFTDGNHARYLTPNAARRCGLIVRAYDAELLSRDEVAAESPEWSWGDPVCRDWLLSA